MSATWQVGMLRPLGYTESVRLVRRPTHVASGRTHTRNRGLRVRSPRSWSQVFACVSITTQRFGDGGSGRGFRTGVQDGGSGRGFITRVHDGGSRRGSRRGFTTEVPDEGSRRSSRARGLNLRRRTCRSWFLVRGPWSVIRGSWFVFGGLPVVSIGEAPTNVHEPRRLRCID